MSPDPAVNDAGNKTKTRPARILIVEDDFLVALSLENQLVDAGYGVVGIASTSEDAISLARAETPDLAVVDIRLAGEGDGVNVAVTLFEDLAIPSIFATAHADENTRRRAERAQARGWLRKPFTADSLVAAVERALAADC